MPRTVTATYETADAARNAYDDLIASGFPREKILFDESRPDLKVMVPSETSPEAREILGRHRPGSISEDET